jgi:hypothetical protein
MDNREARFILEAYRPGGQDAGDPYFTGALEQARRDPELAKWFEVERALDAAIAAKVQLSPVPVTLKADILAGRKVVAVAPFWQRRTLWAAAAALIALLSLAVLWQLRIAAGRPQFAAFHADMSQFLNHIERLDFQNEDMAKIRHWLASHEAHTEIVLPPRLEGQPGVGCRVLEWQGHKVSLVCYYLRPEDGRRIDELHLLVIDRDELRDAPPADAPLFATAGKWETASWSDDRHAYILAGLAKGNYLRGYFAQAGR